MFSNINKHPKTFLFSLVLGFFLLLLSFIPSIYEASLSNKLVDNQRVMIWGEHVYTYDYNVYLSKIRQGIDGRFNIVNKYDHNIHQKGVFLQMLYVLSGKVGGLFGFGSVLTFHSLKLLTCIGWIIMLVLLNFFFLKKSFHIALGLTLSLFASSWPLFFQHGTEWWADHYMPWWQEMDVLYRLNYLPHYTVNYILMAVMTILLVIYVENKKRVHFALMAFLFSISFFIHPSGGVIFFLSWLSYFTLQVFLDKRFRRERLVETVFLTIMLVCLAAIPSLYFRYATSLPQWQALTQFDPRSFIVFNFKDYLLALGPIVVTGVLGAILAIIKRDKRVMALSCWIIGALLSFFIFKNIPDQFGLRMVETANHVPLAILTVFFLSELTKKTGNLLIKIAIYGFIGLVIVIGILNVYFSLKRNTDFIHQRSIAGVPLVPYPSQVLYPLKDFYNGIIWLEQYTKDTDVVLSAYTAGNYIPAYAGNFVYLGHHPETPHFYDKEAEAKTFFSGSLTPDDAYNFLKKNSIAYIFYGPQEAEGAIKPISDYPFVRPAYTSNLVNIFKVNYTH